MPRGLRAALLICLSMSGTAVAEAGDGAPSERNGFYILGRLGTALPIDQDVAFNGIGPPSGKANTILTVASASMVRLANISAMAGAWNCRTGICAAATVR